MMDAVCDNATEMVVIKTSSQVGKTEMINNVLGYYIHQDPAPIMLMQPTLDMAMAYSKDRLRPMVRDTPVLKERMQSRYKGGKGVQDEDGKQPSTLLHKTFPGGHVTMVGANSAASLASRPIRIMLADEVDRAPLSAGEEGDPINLAKKRTTTYWNKKIVLVSTPTVEGQSRIDTAFQQSDQRHYYVPCPHCGHFQRLVWANVQWPEDQPHEARYMCDDCGVLWSDAERWKSVSLGEWRASEDFNGIAGFHINEMYSPWVRLGSTAAAFIEAKHAGPEFLQVWTNTSLGECWSLLPDQAIQWGDLYRRREHYIDDDGRIPNDILAITCSIDTQDDRFELEFVGWGEGEESWGLDYVRLYGDPARPGIWQKLTEAVRRTFMRRDGVVLDVKLVTVDSGGHYTDEVYQWSLKAGRRWAIPIKGMATEGMPVARFPRKPGKDHRVYLTMVGTTTAKEVCYARYNILEPGPGYCHFPVAEAYDEEYFQQLVSEVRERRVHMGREKYIWVPTRKRNEASDIRVYALAAIRILTSHFGTKLEKLPQPTQNTAVPEQNHAQPRNIERKKSKRKSFVDYDGDWL